MKTPLKPTNTLKSAKTAIWTIEHSNRPQKIFREMLREHRIEVLIDIRRFPTSKVEHFKREALEEWLPSMESSMFGWVKS